MYTIYYTILEQKMKELERPLVFSSTDRIAGSKPGDFTIKIFQILNWIKINIIILHLINLMVMIHGIISIQHTIMIRLVIHMIMEKPTLQLLFQTEFIITMI